MEIHVKAIDSLFINGKSMKELVSKSLMKEVYLHSCNLNLHSTPSQEKQKYES